jgi:hypothetical protein
LTRKDAKDGATKQGRASANSNNGKRQRIPRASGLGRKKGLAHEESKDDALHIVKMRGDLWE